MTTKTPLSIASGHAATRMALSKLYKPSLPSSLEERMAPVMTIGIRLPMVVSKKKAVSSKVSVPWVMTIPAKPANFASWMRSFSWSISWGVMWGLGRLKMSSTTSSTSSGTVIGAESSGLLAPGATFFVKESSCMAIVPPVWRTKIRFIGFTCFVSFQCHCSTKSID